MPQYRLVPSGKPSMVPTDEIILARDEDTGEVTASVSVGEAADLDQKYLPSATDLANQLGYVVVEIEVAEAPPPDQSSDQPSDQPPQGEQPAAGEPPANPPQST